MEKLKKLLTLKTKLLVMLISISLVPVILAGTISYYTSLKILTEKLEVTSSQTTQEITRGINNYFFGMSNLIKILSNDINIQAADNETYFEFGKGLLANVKSTDPAIINVFVGTEKGMLYIDPYAELPKDYDHKTRKWYIDALQNPGDITITEPYVDAMTGQMVVTMAKAIINKDKAIGVVGIDIDLSILSGSLSDIKTGDTGYIYITDSNGIMIAHPDKTTIGTDIVTTLAFWQKAKNEGEGFYTYEYQGQDKFASQNTSDITGWKIIAAMNYSELSNDTSVMRNVIVIILFVTIVCAIIFALLFSTPIARNIKSLLEAFKRLAQGDLTASVSIKSTDEFDLLGRNFNDMTQNISMLIRNVNEASGTVLDTSVALANAAEETNSSLYEVARAVEEVAKGATEQAQNASEGAYSITELADTLNQINISTDTIDTLSKNTNELTKQGLHRVDALIQKSDRTVQSTNQVSELVYETRSSMDRIAAISNTIDAITAQTNLLSLNASIEAARAGESGKGFAVVANEIRKLADQSKTSTVKIKEILEDISTKTNQSVEAMEAANQNVKDQVLLVNQTRELFNDIAKAINILSDKVTEIKQNTVDITVKKNDVVSQIENISAISEESASATEEVTASTEQITGTMDEITQQAVDLQRLSEQLQERINRFKF